MARLQHRQQALGVEPLGVLEVQPHALGEGFIPFRDRIPQITDRNQLAELEILAPIHQQLQHQLQCRALALQRRRHRNQGLHQRRAEGIDLAEQVAVGLGGQQGVEHVAAQPQHVLEGGLQGLPRRFVTRTQHALLRDRGQVAVFQRHAVKARLPVLEHVAELQLQRSGQVLSHQVAQIALPCDEAHQRNRPVGVGRLDQLHQLGALAADEAHVRRMARQPQHQLVEEQDHRVVAEVARVPAHDRQPVVQRHEALATGRQRAVGREELPDQVAHQPRPLLAVRRLQHRRLEARRIPAAVERPPATSCTALGAGV